MPSITVQMFDGRTIDEKRELVKALTNATCQTLNCKPESVTIILQEHQRENWSTGGKLWSD